MIETEGGPFIYREKLREGGETGSGLACGRVSDLSHDWSSVVLVVVINARGVPRPN